MIRSDAIRIAFLRMSDLRILSMTSRPVMTLPKTVYFPSSSGVGLRTM